MIWLVLLILDVVWTAQGEIVFWLGAAAGAMFFSAYVEVVIDYARRPR